MSCSSAVTVGLRVKSGCLSAGNEILNAIWKIDNRIIVCDTSFVDDKKIEMKVAIGLCVFVGWNFHYKAIIIFKMEIGYL